MTSVNNCLSCLKIILKKADKAKEIDFNFYTSGCDKVDKIKDIRTREEKIQTNTINRKASTGSI